LPKPVDYNNNKSKYEVIVYLWMLQGGNGRYLRTRKLYFSYKAPFHSFLRSLQDATQLCVIPPLRIDNESPVTKEACPEIAKVNTESTTSEAVVASEEEQETMESVDQRVPSSSSSRAASISLDGLSSSDDSTTFLDHIDPGTVSQRMKVLKNRPLPRAFNASERSGPCGTRDRGYTLDDGPWSYIVVNEASPQSGRIWQMIANSDEYLQMLETIRRRAEGCPKDTISAVVMHVSLHL
jgi:hypothetical protein